MYCSNCGQEGGAGKFCMKCGQPLMASAPAAAPAMAASAPAPEVKKKNVPAILFGALSLVLAVLVALMFTGILQTSSGGGAVSEGSSVGFDTPEDAIEYFYSHAASGDYSGALNACAAEYIAKNFDYENFIKRLKVITLSIQYLPSEYELYSQFNYYAVKTSVMRQLSFIAMSVSLPEEYEGLLAMKQIPDNGYVDFDNVVSDMNPKAMSSLKVLEVSEHKNTTNSNYKENMKKQAASFGADDQTTRDVLFEIGGEYFAGGVTLLKYGGKWYVSALIEPLINQPSTGALIKLESKADFEDLLG